jgi:hypothetical protein
MAGKPCTTTICPPLQWHRRSHPRPLLNRLLILASCQNVPPSPMHVVPRQVNTTHPFFSHLNTHAFILCNSPFSLSALSILFPLVPGERCMGNSPACRMFSCSCTVWVSLAPRSPRSLQFLQNRSQSFSSLSPLDRTLSSYL